MPPKKAVLADPPKLIIYKIKTDNNTAPHISKGILTLTLCKPVVRKGANLGDYVLAILADGNDKISEIKHMFTERKKEARKKKDGSLEKIEEEEINFLKNDKYWLTAYLFRVDHIVTMQEYESWCATHNKNRICNEDNFSGDCQYFGPNLEYRPGPHGPSEINRNRSGKNSLISRHYAAWTSDRPYLLSSEQRANLQLDDAELKALGVGQTYIDITKKLTNKRIKPITEADMIKCFRQCEELIHEWQEATHGPVGKGKKIASFATAASGASAANGASAASGAAGAGPSAAGAGPSASVAAKTLFSTNQMADLEAAFLGLSAKNKTAKSAGRGGRRKTRRNHRESI